MRLLGLYDWLQQQHLNVSPRSKEVPPTLGFRVLCTRQLVESKRFELGSEQTALYR